MEILITRHGETNANKREVVCGWYNSSLNEIGKNQAKKFALRLEKEKIDVIFCSDLNRCKQTIAPYLKKHNTEIHYDLLLREQCNGIFEGKPLKNMVEWFKNNPGKEPKGWESKEKLKERINKFWGECSILPERNR
jgi:broad specificity phosphatase PhoE